MNTDYEISSPDLSEDFGSALRKIFMSESASMQCEAWHHQEVMDLNASLRYAANQETQRVAMQTQVEIEKENTSRLKIASDYDLEMHRILATAEVSAERLKMIAECEKGFNQLYAIQQQETSQRLSSLQQSLSESSDWAQSAAISAEMTDLRLQQNSCDLEYKKRNIETGFQRKELMNSVRRGRSYSNESESYGFGK